MATKFFLIKQSHLLPTTVISHSHEKQMQTRPLFFKHRHVDKQIDMKVSMHAPNSQQPLRVEHSTRRLIETGLTHPDISVFMFAEVYSIDIEIDTQRSDICWKIGNGVTEVGLLS